MKPEIKKLLILNLPYLLFVWLFDKVGAAVRLSCGYNPYACIAHTVKKRVKLPPLRVLLRRRF